MWWVKSLFAPYKTCFLLTRSDGVVKSYCSTVSALKQSWSLAFMKFPLPLRVLSFKIFFLHCNGFTIQFRLFRRFSNPFLMNWRYSMALLSKSPSLQVGFFLSLVGFSSIHMKWLQSFRTFLRPQMMLSGYCHGHRLFVSTDASYLSSAVFLSTSSHLVCRSTLWSALWAPTFSLASLHGVSVALVHF